MPMRNLDEAVLMAIIQIFRPDSTLGMLSPPPHSICAAENQGQFAAKRALERSTTLFGGGRQGTSLSANSKEYVNQFETRIIIAHTRMMNNCFCFVEESCK